MVCNLGNGAFYNGPGENYKCSRAAEVTILQPAGPAAPTFFPQVTAGERLGIESRQRHAGFGTALAFLFSRQRGCESGR
jgi:hypothetical protein